MIYECITVTLIAPPISVERNNAELAIRAPRKNSVNRCKWYRGAGVEVAKMEWLQCVCVFLLLACTAGKVRAAF